MKGSRNQMNKQSKQGKVNKPVPEVRDDLDSRERQDANYRKEDDDRNKEDKKRYGKNR